MSSSTTHRCEGEFVPYQGWRLERCTKHGKHQSANGKWYCGTHSPEHVEARAKKRSQALRERWHERDRRWAQQATALKNSERNRHNVHLLRAGIANMLTLVEQNTDGDVLRKQMRDLMSSLLDMTKTEGQT